MNRLTCMPFRKWMAQQLHSYRISSTLYAFDTKYYGKFGWQAISALIFMVLDGGNHSRNKSNSWIRIAMIICMEWFWCVLSIYWSSVSNIYYHLPAATPSSSAVAHYWFMEWWETTEVLSPLFKLGMEPFKVFGSYNVHLTCDCVYCIRIFCYYYMQMASEHSPFYIHLYICRFYRIVLYAMNKRIRILG